jgi:hypothetical protein
VAAVHPLADAVGEHSGRREQRSLVDLLGPQLSQQRGGVERITRRVLPQASDSPLGRAMRCGPRCEVAERREWQTRQLDLASGKGGQSVEALRESVRAKRHDREHPVALKPPQGEQQCLQRQSVSPVGVVDHHAQRPAVLDVAQTGQEVGADLNRMLQPPRPF